MTLVMRIITGKYRNRKIQMPKGMRPTQNIVRKAVFDILGDISGLAFLELFAGSGAVGLEALSRGASSLVMVESNRDSILAIKKNIQLLEVSDCNLYNLEADKGVKLLFLNKKHFDIIFVDPPYLQEMAKKILQTLEGYDILAPHGLIVIQHSKAELLAKNTLKFDLIKEVRYGDTQLSIYRKKD
jgi:16S rRNA (guanine(966)-N(2))-methyltransferase RsmD